MSSRVQMRLPSMSRTFASTNVAQVCASPDAQALARARAAETICCSSPEVEADWAAAWRATRKMSGQSAKHSLPKFMVVLSGNDEVYTGVLSISVLAGTHSGIVVVNMQLH